MTGMFTVNEHTHTLHVLLIVMMCQMLNCFYNCINSLIRCEVIKLSLKLSTALQREVLWCQVLHINYTTDNICDSLRSEVRGVDTKYLFVQQNSVRSSSMAGHVASLIPLVKSANIILHLNFQMLHNSWLCLIFISPPSLSFSSFGENSTESLLK